jgi:hypothetical protein
MKIKIPVDIEEDHFLIKNQVLELLDNKRMRLTFKRLGYSVENDSIQIPFRNETKIDTLQEIINLLNKFDYETVLSNNAEKDVKDYHREEQLFEEFSNSAKLIRNDRFNENQELVEKFDVFQRTLSNNLVRTLYPLQLLSAFHMAFAQNVCNFSVPGAGKTSIVYGAYAYLNSLRKEDPKFVDSLLIIGPISSFAPWENEYRACFGRAAKSFRISGNS